MKDFQLTVFDTQQLEDITDSVDHFELIDNMNIGTYAWLTIKDKRIGLCPKREHSINDVYSIRIKDDGDNEVHKMMEVADEISYEGIPFFLTFHTQHNYGNVKGE